MVLKKLIIVGGLVMFSVSAFAAKGMRDDYRKTVITGDQTSTVKLERLHKRTRTDFRLRMANAPAYCPTNNQACKQTAGNLVYVFCTHTGGGTPTAHMDIYFGPSSGVRLGRVDVPLSTIPSGCPN